VPAIRLFINIETSEPWLPVRVILALPLSVLKGVLVKLTEQVRSNLRGHSVDGPGWDPTARVVVSVVLHDAPTLLTLLEVVATEEGPATDKLGLNRAVRVKNRLVEDDPGLTLREDLPRAMVAVIAVCNWEGHLAGIISDLIERIDLLDDGTLNHMVIPSLTEVVIVKNIVNKFRLQIFIVGLDLDSSNRGIRSRLCQNLKVLLGILRGDGETFITVHDVKEFLEFLISSDVLLTLL